MISVVAIVEGHGEVRALPVLLRRLHEWKTPEANANILKPIRVSRDRFINKNDEFSRVLALASAKAGADGWILILLDADDDCPAELGAIIQERAQAEIPHRQLSVVLANREYEAWFIAAASSLHGERTFSYDPERDSVEPEDPRDAKGWIRSRMASGSYGETTDQPAFSARIELQQAYDRSRSFRKLCSEWQSAIGEEG